MHCKSNFVLWRYSASYKVEGTQLHESLAVIDSYLGFHYNASELPILLIPEFNERI